MVLAVIEQERIPGSAETAVKAGRDLLRRITAPAPDRRARPPSGRLVAVVEIALVLLLAAATIPLFWALFGPGPIIGSPPPAVRPTGAPTVSGNPFRLADAPAAPVGDVGPANVDTTLDLALHGTWVDAERPSAIIRLPDGTQKTFFVGDAICCGATLAGVYTDQVTISRGGAHEALRLPNKGSDSAQAPPATPVVETTPAEATGIGNVIRFQPVDDGGMFRLQLAAGDDPELFRSLGLRDGDILVSINNQPAPDDAVAFAQVLQSIQGSRMVTVTVDRGGVRLPLDIPLGSDGAPAGDGEPQ